MGIRIRVNEPVSALATDNSISPWSQFCSTGRIPIIESSRIPAFIFRILIKIAIYLT